MRASQLSLVVILALCGHAPLSRPLHTITGLDYMSHGFPYLWHSMIPGLWDTSNSTQEVSVVSLFLGNSSGHFLLQPLSISYINSLCLSSWAMLQFPSFLQPQLGWKSRKQEGKIFSPVLGRGVKKGSVGERKEVEAFEMKAGPSSSEINAGKAQLVW